MAVTDEAAQTRYKEAMEFLHRTLKFIRSNKDLLAHPTGKHPLSFREIVDTIEERIESHLREWDTQQLVETHKPEGR